jgi:hypothetical protein
LKVKTFRASATSSSYQDDLSEAEKKLGYLKSEAGTRFWDRCPE